MPPATVEEYCEASQRIQKQLAAYGDRCLLYLFRGGHGWGWQGGCDLGSGGSHRLRSPLPDPVAALEALLEQVSGQRRQTTLDLGQELKP